MSVCRYREIVEKYGKMQVPRGASEARLQLYETFRVSARMRMAWCSKLMKTLTGLT